MAPQDSKMPAPTPGTFFDLLVEVDGVHRGGDDVGLAVAGSHNPGNLVHELHGDTWVGGGRGSCLREASGIWEKPHVSRQGLCVTKATPELEELDQRFNLYCRKALVPAQRFLSRVLPGRHPHRPGLKI